MTTRRRMLPARRGFCSGLAASLLARPERARAALVPAPADAFVDSVGLCVHLDSPPYDARFDAVARAAAELGVRHLRDELRPSNDLARWRTLHEQAGIRSHLLVSPATNTVAEMLDYLGALGSERVSAVEGQNEGDSDWFMAQPSARPGWAQVVAQYQRAVFTALRARYSPARLPVLSPTVLDYKPDDMRLLRPAAPFCDMVAVHAYVQGMQEPETTDPYAALGWYLREVSAPFKPGAPVMVTEAGYHTGAGGVSQAAAAKYAPRLLLHAFSLGVVRTFLYEFMDEGTQRADSEQNYGLLTSAGERKPVFHAVRALLQALADPGPTPARAPLRIGIPGAPADLRAVPLQKRDGEVVLALWRARRSWDPAARRDITVPPASVRLTLQRSFAAAASLLLGPDRSWTRLALRGGGADITVDDTVTLLRLRP